MNLEVAGTDIAAMLIKIDKQQNEIAELKIKADMFKGVADEQVVEIAELKEELNSLDSFAMSPKMGGDVNGILDLYAEISNKIGEITELQKMAYDRESINSKDEDNSTWSHNRT